MPDSLSLFTSTMKHPFFFACSEWLTTEQLHLDHSRAADEGWYWPKCALHIGRYLVSSYEKKFIIVLLIVYACNEVLTRESITISRGFSCACSNRDDCFPWNVSRAAMWSWVWKLKWGGVGSQMRATVEFRGIKKIVLCGIITTICIFAWRIGTIIGR